MKIDQQNAGSKYPDVMSVNTIKVSHVTNDTTRKDINTNSNKLGVISIQKKLVLSHQWKYDDLT